MDENCQIRNDKGKLCGYAAEEKGVKYLALFDSKKKYLGRIEAKDLYVRLTEGPCIDLELQTT